MKPAWLGGLPPFNRLLFFFLLMIASLGVIFLLGMLMAGPLFGVSITRLPAMLSDYEDPSAIGLLKYFQILQSFGLFILPPLLAGFFFERNPGRYLRLDFSPRPKIYLLVFFVLLAMGPLVNGMIDWNESLKLPGALRGIETWMQQTEESATRLTDAFMDVQTIGGFLLNILMIAILPALGEEFVFRGVLQRLLGEWTRNMHVAILLSALAFSTMHLQFYGLLPRFFLGVVFGYFFFWTGSLWVPVFAHFLNNAAAIVAEALIDSGRLSEEAMSYGGDSLPAIAASVVLTGMFLYLLRRNHLQPGRNREPEI